MPNADLSRLALARQVLVDAALAAQLASQVSVTVVSRRPALANALRIASRRVIYLDVPSHTWEFLHREAG
jgi:hypothetical protein